MWREVIPPNAPPPIPQDEPEPIKPKVQKVRLFWDLIAWWRNARERKLLKRIARLEAKLATVEYERDFLAEANECLRQWQRASSETACMTADMLAGRREQKTAATPAPKRSPGGAYG